MLPAPPGLGGIDLHVSLPPAEMATLRALMTGSHAGDELSAEMGDRFATIPELL